MPVIWGVITGFFGRLFTINLATDVIKWVAFRALMLTLFVTVMPIIFHNLVIWSMRFGGSILMRYMSLMGADPQFEAVVLNVSGLGGYLANCLQIPQCFAIIMTALTARLALNMFAKLPMGRIF